MRPVTAGLVFTILLVSGAARGESASDALKSFGLIGTWSPDCAKDPTKEPGMRVTYRVPLVGPPTETVVWHAPNIIAEEVKWEVKSAVRITEDKLRVTSIFLEGKQIGPPYMKRVQITQPSDTLIIRTGKNLQFGDPANIYEKCLN